MTDASSTPGPTTEGADYTQRLQRVTGAGWKKALNVQAPYRWNVRRLDLGFTLDVGCGLGRNLGHLDGNGVGVDHNAASIAQARAAGFTAFTIDDFLASEYAVEGRFDSILVAHVVEHAPEEQAKEIVGMYLPYLKQGGRVVFITPQERGYKTDATHVRFCGHPEVAKIATDLGLTVDKQYSFPFPRAAGKVFTYNEFVTVARKP